MSVADRYIPALRFRALTRFCTELGFLGVAVDDEANVLLRGEGEIAAGSSTVRVSVVQSRETL